MDETLNEQNPTTVSEPAEIYLEASVLARGTTSQELKQAVALFESIPDYLDSRQQAANIQQQFLSLRKDEQSAQFSAFFYKAKNWLLYGGKDHLLGCISSVTIGRVGMQGRSWDHLFSPLSFSSTFTYPPAP